MSMSTCQELEPRLGLFVDRHLPADEHQSIAAHVEGCARCRGLVDDLTRLREAARTLGPMAPPDHIWLEVAGQIRLGDRPGTPAPAVVSAPKRAMRQWIGLAAALVIITFGAYFLTRPVPRSDVASNPAGPGSVEVVAEELTQAMAHYDKAISELDRIAKSGDGALDPAVAETLQKNLSLVDQAITESRAALQTDPQSSAARDSLFEALRRKVSVLQATVTLMNEMRKGNQQGAAAAGKKSS
jgi:hypothetical protein